MVWSVFLSIERTVTNLFNFRYLGDDSSETGVGYQGERSGSEQVRSIQGDGREKEG